MSEKVIYKNESYEVVGCCFEVFNKIGYGHKEKTYQKAFSEVFKEKKVTYQEQYYLTIKINDKVIAKQFFDFLAFGKIILEIKVGDYFHKRDIDQLHSYLKSSNLKLGILVNFTPNGVNFHRVLNAY